MASTTLFGLYSTWDKYDEALETTLADDRSRSVALASYRRLDSLVPNGHDSSVASTEIVSPANRKTYTVMPEKPVCNDMIISGPPATPPLNGYAVQINRVTHTYGTGRKQVVALRRVSLNVPAGQIYGLLGPSGCGKTTLLRCMVGRLQPESGTIRVYGKRPGDPGAAVPGPLIGYMPQELALFPDFTIQETLYFFGRLFGMRDSNIKERVKFLVKFLELPDKRRLVGNLSGGQKRRVSLAVALIHSPPLLILDEPTVGVDPVLRQTIWSYLVTLTQTTQLTVIITTHYIEEARAASMVGLMRFGHVLCEASPDYLMQRFAMSTLEEVFLKLCEMDAILNGSGTPNKERSLQKIDLEDDEMLRPDLVSMNRVEQPDEIVVANGDDQKIISSIEEAPSTTTLTTSDSPMAAQLDQTLLSTPTFGKTSALFKKNVIRLRRNLPVLLFQFLLPSIEIILFCVCIGQDPFNIPMAVYNAEQFTGDRSQYGEMFIKQINNQTLNLMRYNSSESALDAVRLGTAWGAIIVPLNFSAALQSRVIMSGGVDDDIVEQSNINVHLDMTNQIIGYELQRKLYNAWQSFSRKLSLRMGQNPEAFEMPIKFDEPIYGTTAPSFTEFMAPGVLLSIAFLAAVALTALAFVMERKEGLLERSLVAGVSSYEFMFSHVLTQLLVLGVQIALLLMFTFLVFGIPSEGYFIWVVLLTLLQGSCGMAYGLMISALCKEENSATMLALGSFYPNLLLSGTVWPVQAMPDFMRYFSYLLPQTVPIESMRYILSRGWGPEQPEVALGFLITIGWTTFFLISAVLIFKLKK